MRQNQKNNRSRGRGGRKGPNPLTRSYESNGPEVKVRGTAQHIAEKYMSLARDAISSGDNVVAENYFQHAEHYNRIIMAAQAQANAQREEERKNSSTNEADDQPRVEPQREENSKIVVSTDEASAKRDASKPAVNGSGNSSDHSQEAEAEGSGDESERPKPRGRRPSTRSRGKPSSKSSASDDSGADNGDSIADNPPAFLMSD